MIVLWNVQTRTVPVHKFTRLVTTTNKKDNALPQFSDFIFYYLPLPLSYLLINISAGLSKLVSDLLSRLMDKRFISGPEIFS